MNTAVFSMMELDIVCFIIMIGLIFNLNRNGVPKLSPTFICVILCMLYISINFLLYASTNASCYALYGKNSVCTSKVDMMVYYTCIQDLLTLIIPYAVFIFLFTAKNRISRSHDAKAVLITVPFVLATVLIVLSPFFGFVEFLSFKGYIVTGRYHVVYAATVGFYSILAIIYGLLKMHESRTLLVEFSSSRILYFFLYASVVLPFVLTFVSTFIDFPIAQVGFAISGFFLITIHNFLKISFDDFSGLNNRNELNAYLERIMAMTAQQRANTFMMFIDINKFKHINDKYGHYEGDVVILQISRLLKAVANKFNCFLCRYGGDEFILIKSNSNGERVTSICKYIEKSVDSLHKLSVVEYELSVSTGYVRFDKRFKSPKDFIEAADKLMYEAKRSEKTDFSKLKGSGI